MFNNMKLYTPDAGFTVGNLFPDLYKPYKNYKPKELIPKNDKEKLLIEIDRNAFAAHELNLYLDLNPDNEEMLMLFNDYRKESRKLIDEYEEKYGPLTLQSNTLENNPFLWEELDFPFVGGNKDVGL